MKYSNFFKDNSIESFCTHVKTKFYYFELTHFIKFIYLSVEFGPKNNLHLFFSNQVILF